MSIPNTAIFKLSPTDNRLPGDIRPRELYLFLGGLPSQALTVEELEAIQLEAVPRRGNVAAQKTEPKTP